MDKLVYPATKLVLDDLVDRVHHWPGTNGRSIADAFQSATRGAGS